MFSCMSPPRHFLIPIPPRLLGDLYFRTISPPLAVAVNPRLRSSGFFGRLKGRHYEGCWCSSKGWESEADVTLEAEILEFMETSEKPEAFPTREELVNAGRTDLAEAIVRKGGWLSAGWDFGDDILEEEEEEVEVVGLTDKDCDSSGGSSVWTNSCHSPSSSGRSLEMGDEQETGIEGILTRLEKQRNLSFGINLGGNGYSARALSRDGGNESHIETSKYVDMADLGRSSGLASGSPNKGIFNNSGSKISHAGSVLDFDSSRSSVKPEMWQTWSIRRAGISDSEFEAAEISFHDNQMDEGNGASKDEIHAITEGSTEALNKQKDISHNEIRARLRHLEVELTSALLLLRSNSEKHVPEDGHETSDDLRNLSDAWEFQETEIMSTRDRLRSIRAKLTVAEGKMTLAIIDAQKIVEEKQKRIDGARTALKLLRTTCIVWPNSASEVLLAGSFDGWTTQRKMEKSSTGIFSVCLKLYPGRYEIKFIVDGTWRIDPLRPVVRNDGYENNLLVIS